MGETETLTVPGVTDAGVDGIEMRVESATVALVTALTPVDTVSRLIAVETSLALEEAAAPTTTPLIVKSPWFKAVLPTVLPDATDE